MAYGDDRRWFKKIISFYQRKIKWRHYELGEGFHAGKNVRLWAPNSIKTGRFCYLGRGSQIECDAELGNYVFAGNNVALVGRYDHNWQEIGKPMLFSQRIKDKDYNWKGLGQKTIIGDDVWIGYGSIIMSGIKIGQGSIIAAGSVVTRDVESFCIYGGVPAKKLANRFDDEEQVRQHIKLYKENWE